MDLFFPFCYVGYIRGCGATVARRPSKPNIAGSNPATRSNSACTFSTHMYGARDAQHEGCRQGSCRARPETTGAAAIRGNSNAEILEG